MAEESAKTYVLVHGAYHGGWCWRGVADRLRARGHLVFTPTQTGLGERAHLLEYRPTLETFIQDIAGVILAEELTDVILVGHSFAGSIVSALADRMPERLRHLVYLDALIMNSGETTFSGLPPDIGERYRQRALETSGGLSVPPPPPEYFNVTDPEQIAWLGPKLTPHPYEAFNGKLILKGPIANGLPVTFIAVSKPYFRSIASSREFALSQPGWSYRELPTGHDAMVTLPDETAAMLAEIG